MGHDQSACARCNFVTPEQHQDVPQHDLQDLSLDDPTTEEEVRGAHRASSAISTGNTEEAQSMANLIEALPDPRIRALERLQNEFKVQKSVWDSLALAKQQSPQSLPEAPVREILTGVLEVAATDPDAATVRMQEVFSASDQKKHCAALNKATKDACLALLAAADSLTARAHIIRELRRSGESPVAGSGLAEEEEISRLEKLLATADLQEARLDYRVRHALGLGLKSAVKNASHLSKGHVVVNCP